MRRVIKRTLLVISLLLMTTGCGESAATCARQCGEIRTLFAAPCGSQHSGTPAECAAWITSVSTMTRALDQSLQGKHVQADVSEALPRLMTSLNAFESHRCAEIHVDNISATDARQSKCNEALIAARGDLGFLYFSAEVPD